MKVLWICGLPEAVRVSGGHLPLAPNKMGAWGWILGHLPPPVDVELHIACMARNLISSEIHLDYYGAHWHCYREMRGEQYLLQLPLIFKMCKLKKQIRPDVVCGWGPENGNAWIARMLDANCVVNVQGVLPLLNDQTSKYGLTCEKRRWIDVWTKNRINDLTFKISRNFVVESLFSGEAVRKYYGCPSRVIFQPLRGEFLSSVNKMKLPDVPTFLFVGQLLDRKGPLDALKAFREMTDKSARMVIVGEGTLEPKVHAFVNRSGLLGRITFLRGLSAEDLIQIMHRSDIFILPSYGDTGPTALKEALSQGLYPICYDNTGPKEHIERYGFGALGKTGNWRSLIPLMDGACLRRQGLREQGKMVAERIKQDLSPENIWPQIIDEYKKIICK